MTTKGQITVPKAVRDRLRLEPGDKVYFDVGDEGMVRIVVRHHPMERLFGLLRHRVARGK